MRRPPARVLIRALAATLVSGLLLGLPAAPVSAGPGPDTLFIAAGPTGDTSYSGTYKDGQQLYIRVNINEGDNDVFQASLETDKSGSFQPITGQTNKTTNSFGKYTFTYTPTGEQNLRATWVQEGVTRYSEVLHLAPVVPPPVAPTGPDVGNLYQDPTTYHEGDSIKLTANFPSGSFNITFYKLTAPDVWTAFSTLKSNSSGNASYSGFAVSGTQKVFARKSNNDRTEVDDIAPTPKLTLDIARDCTGNDCGNTATATGTFDPALAGRVLKLQYLNGSTWTQVGDTTTTGADGKAQVPLDLTGLSQWSARKYRMVSDAEGSNPAAVSQPVSFMPGPTQLGKNVLRVDVDEGVFPVTKGPEYTGKATLSVDGVVTYNQVLLESFGVRGSATAKLAKKPYKLKFDKSPKNGVFGMAADKSWTLLANFKDQSLIRDKVGLDLGRRMSNISWTPDSRYVELFVNDRYDGSYLVTESVKIDGDRVNVDKEKGMIMEVTSAVIDSSVDFKSAIGQIVFRFKDPDERKTLDDGTPDPESVTSAKFSAIRSRINAFESKLYSSSTRNQYPNFLDVASAIDFHLVKEFTKDTDADFYRSHYFSWDPSGTVGNPLADGTFHFGPAWDFDVSAGNNTSTDPAKVYASSPEGWMMRGTGTPSGHPNYKTHWFVQLFKDAAFKAAVEARWAEVKGEFSKVFESDTAAFNAAIGVGAENDRARWAHEPKVFASRGTHDEEIAFVTNWYEARYTWIDGQLSP